MLEWILAYQITDVKNTRIKSFRNLGINNHNVTTAIYLRDNDGDDEEFRVKANMFTAQSFSHT